MGGRGAGRNRLRGSSSAQPPSRTSSEGVESGQESRSRHPKSPSDAGPIGPRSLVRPSSSSHQARQLACTTASSYAFTSTRSSFPPTRFSDAVGQRPAASRARRHVWDADAPRRSADAGPDPAQRSVQRQVMAPRRPNPAALNRCVDQTARNAFNLTPPQLGRDYEQDVIAGRLRPTAKVGDVGRELAVKAFCLFASPTELAMEKDLPIAPQEPPPAVA